MEKKKKIIIIVVIALVVVIVAGAIVAFNVIKAKEKKNNKIEMDALISEIEYEGVNGGATNISEITLDENKVSKYESTMDKEDAETFKKLIKTVKISADGKTNLSNGDKLPITVAFDRELEEKSNFTIEEKQNVTVKGLPEDNSYYMLVEQNENLNVYFVKLGKVGTDLGRMVSFNGENLINEKMIESKYYGLDEETLEHVQAWSTLEKYKDAMYAFTYEGAKYYTAGRAPGISPNYISKITTKMVRYDVDSSDGSLSDIFIVFNYKLNDDDTLEILSVEGAGDHPNAIKPGVYKKIDKETYDSYNR